MRRLSTVFWSMALTVSLLSSPALARDLPKDAKDHPLVTRFAGADLIAYQHQDFDELYVPVKAIEDDGKVTPDLVAKVTGKITHLGYRLDASKTALEVIHNYEEALTGAGFETVFSCVAETCGDGLGSYLVLGGKVMPTSFTDVSFNRNRNRYLLVKRDTVYVLLYAMEDNSNKQTLIYEAVAETKPMQTGQVQVMNADQMTSSLAATGKVAVYGIYFDTAKAEIKPDSQPALAEMVKALQQKADMKVYIVGHTDNNGTLGANITLSQQRADAVVKALTSGGIAPDRVIAKGVASLSPVAPNIDEAGRSKNRRVEMVVQ